MFYQKIWSFIQRQLKYISTTCKTAMTTSGKISKNMQFQNTHDVDVMEAFDSKGIINTLEKYCQPWNMLTLQLSLSLRDR